jgi:hypothetical protein
MSTRFCTAASLTCSLFSTFVVSHLHGAETLEFGRDIRAILSDAYFRCHGGSLNKTNYGRDHHPQCFTIWMAGGGVTPGTSYGETDDYNYNVAKDPVHVHDLNATILHLLGIDHRRLTYQFQGRNDRLTDAHGKVIELLLT